MRPFGVTLICLYQMIRGAIGLVFGLFVLVYQGPANKLAAVSADGNAIERFIGRIGHPAGLVFIVFAVVHLLAAYGLWRMQNWGRLVTILLSAVELVLVLPGFAQVNVFALSFGVINAACIFYLSIPPIGRAFRSRSNPVRVAV